MNIVNITVEFEDRDCEEDDEGYDYETYGILKMNDISIFETKVNLYSEPAAVEEVIERFAKKIAND
jgi:hypothetical protein